MDKTLYVSFYRDFIDMIELFREVSLLIGIWVAIYGIDSWRREHRGKKDIELAEDVLALFYEARDAVKHMRHPFSPAGECDDIEKVPGETEAQWNARKNASTVYKRYNSRQELFNRLYAMRYRFMAQIGHVESQPFEDFNKLVHEILIAAQMLARLWPRDHFRTDNQYERHREQVEKYEGIFWEGIADQDPINPRIEAIVTRMEQTCRNIIVGKGTLYKFLNAPIRFRKS
jgi:hypothetical protein